VEVQSVDGGQVPELLRQIPQAQRNFGHRLPSRRPRGRAQVEDVVDGLLDPLDPEPAGIG
jgi:hypothetical protein